MWKDNQIFYKRRAILFIVLKRTSIGVHKNILHVHEHICMTRYFLTAGPYLVRTIGSENNIHVYSMYTTFSTYYLS